LPKSEQLQLFSYLEKLFDDKLGAVWTSQPATIDSFNAEDNTLNCTLDKEGITLEDIPIALFGNPQSYITTPTLVKGTKGLLLFSKHDLFEWVESGTDPEAKTDFSKNNAFFLIGATNKGNKITYNMNAIEVKTDKAIAMSSKDETSVDSETGVHISAPKVSVTNSASGDELFALLEETLVKLNDFAQTVSQATDTDSGSALSNAVEIASYTQIFTALSEKYKGFRNV